jgi:hypothetical protein
MVRHIVDARFGRYQLCALIEIDSNRKRVRLGRPVNRWAGQESTPHFQRGSAVNGALFDVR